MSCRRPNQRHDHRAGRVQHDGIADQAQQHRLRNHRATRADDQRVGISLDTSTSASAGYLVVGFTDPLAPRAQRARRAPSTPAEPAAQQAVVWAPASLDVVPVPPRRFTLEFQPGDGARPRYPGPSRETPTRTVPVLGSERICSAAKLPHIKRVRHLRRGLRAVFTSAAARREGSPSIAARASTPAHDLLRHQRFLPRPTRSGRHRSRTQQVRRSPGRHRRSRLCAQSPATRGCGDQAGGPAWLRSAGPLGARPDEPAMRQQAGGRGGECCGS